MTAYFSEIFLYFICYSFIGWVCECIFCSVPEKRFVNRGMLKGPYCPIYGLGALLILPVATPLKGYPLVVFLAAMAVTSALEYFSSWLLERIFNIRWWDYSGQRFQLNGRICLPLSLAFGVMGWVLTYGVHPAVETLIAAIPSNIRSVVANLLIALFLIDLIVTVGSITGMSRRLQELQALLAEVKAYNEQYAWLDRKDWRGSLNKLRAIYEQEEAEAPEGAIKRLDVIDGISRELQSFVSRHPTLDAARWQEAVSVVRESAEKRIHPYSTAVRGVLSKAKSGIWNTGKSAGRSVATRFHYYDLFWVFLIAGVIGYLVETAFCIVTTGTIESRQGLLYGPFNQVYGFGAILMVLLLEPLRQKNDRWLFFGGAVLGGAFEVVVSLIQENVFGSVSWDYSEGAFSVAGGRTSLLFMFFWGILGLWFIKGIYPPMKRAIERIPQKQGKPLVAVLTALLCVNMVLSATAVYRWSDRVESNPAQTAYEQFLDRAYPDEYMEEVYPNMTMLMQEAPEEQP